MPDTEVVDGTADHLPADDASFDAAVASLVLCTVPDVPGASPRSAAPSVRAASCGSSNTSEPTPPAWPASSGSSTPPSGHGSSVAATPHRDTRNAIEHAGFTIKDIETLRIPDTRIPAPASPHILGTATKQG
jgi:hypothetical protein